jgi:DNA-binding beta-propeller fold protein YncE
MVSDPVRHRMYISVRNEVVVLSTDTYLVQNELFVGSQPAGLALSADDQSLYVALSRGGSIVVVNLNTLQWRTVEVATQLGDYEVNDVTEVLPGVVLVGGRNLITVDTNNADQIKSVAGGLDAGGSPWFKKSFDNQYVYVSDRNNERFYKLDNSSADLPVLASSDLWGAGNQFEINKPGNWIIQGGGVIWDSTSFGMLRNGFTDGFIAEQQDYSALMQQAGSGTWSLLDGSSLQETARFLAGCPPVGTTVETIAPVDLRGEWLIQFGSDQLCAISTTAPGTEPGVDGSRSLTAWPTAASVATLETSVGPFPSDMVLDLSRDLIYVSVPQAQQLVLVAANEGGLVGTIPLPGQPNSLMLSADGVHLYVGMGDSGTLLSIDLNTSRVVQTVDLGALLGRPAVGSIFEMSTGILIVGGFNDFTVASYLVQLDLSNTSTAHRIGNSQGYCGGHVLTSPDGHYLYVDGANCSASVEKRDLTSAGLDLIMSGPSDGVQGYSLLSGAVSADGTKLYAVGYDGVVTVDTATMRIIGWVLAGRPFLTSDSSQVLSVSDDSLSRWDTTTYQELGAVKGNCTSIDYVDYGSSAYALWPDRSKFAVLSLGSASVNGSVCVQNTAP